LIVLSAKNEERLQAQARQLLEHLKARRYADVDLIDVAYTLQVGRDAMEHRLGFTALSVAEVEEKLTGYLAGMELGQIRECYRGDIKKNKDSLSVFASDEELHEAIGKWVQRGKYTKLLELWVKGLSFDWSKLYGVDASDSRHRPQRLSLPSYPFARERYWVTPSLMEKVSVKESQRSAFDGGLLSSLIEEYTANTLGSNDAERRIKELLGNI
jgi:polyketide synthase PksN